MNALTAKLGELDLEMRDRKTIEGGRAVLGMELGSTRIKAVLIGEESRLLASGGFDWENSQSEGIWTYKLDEVWKGIANCLANLKINVQSRYDVELKSIAVAGFSAMMHGYLAFDSEGNLLTPFRTWRNNITGEASRELTELFQYPIPQRWSIAHLYQAILNEESHVRDIAYITTLAGYVHWKISSRRVTGVCDASGMFPIDIKTQGFDRLRIERFNERVKARGFSWRLDEILPEIIEAGNEAGVVTEEGARLLDPTNSLKPSISLCPPEGDAGTGMVATNSIRIRSGNVSAGTSVFAMLVLERTPTKVHEEIDLINTPDGKLVGMVHSNNCTSDYDAWIELIGQAISALGVEISTPVLYDTVLALALKGSPDCGGLLSYGYISGEHITGFQQGRPLFVRRPESDFTIGNFIRTHLFSSLCALRTGLDVLTREEGFIIDEIRGHGGFFKTKEVGTRIMAAATQTPVRLLDGAGEGGAWGMALLAAYTLRANREQNLADFLDVILAGGVSEVVKPDPVDVEGFNIFLERYQRGLAIEKAALAALN